VYVGGYGYPYYGGYGWPVYTTFPSAAYGWGAPYNPILSQYGSCDCSGNDYVTRNDCNQGVPVCVNGNCTCYNTASQTSGCFNQRGATCGR